MNFLSIVRRVHLPGGVFSALLIVFMQSASAADITLKPDAQADSTAAIQSALDHAASVVVFPPGTYRIGTLTVPANVTLRFDAKARLVPIPEKVADKNLLVVKGDNVRIEGLRYDFAWNGADINTTPVHNLIYSAGSNGLFVTGADVGNTDPRGVVPLKDRKRRGRLLNIDGTDPAKNYSHHGYYADQCLVYADGGHDITLENSVGYRLHAMINTVGTANVTVRGNRMTSGNYMTNFMEGGESLRHHDNWSRDVKYQVCWFGGSPDPSRKPELPKGSSTVVYRDIKPGDPGYNMHTSGAFDVSVQNNYAEYGNTLAWGNKGRQIVIDGNIARFISDYAYGTEGGENIVFSNNISINSTAAGIVSMYWGEKLLITGNLLITRHEPWSSDWSWWDHPSKYLGPFIRLHHGPEDKENLYGAGTVQITGNQLVNELTQRTVDISIHSGRDVLINGNKIINGRVYKFGPGRLTVMDNEFVSRLSFAPASVNVQGAVDTAIVKGNTFRREPAVSTASEGDKSAELNAVPYFLFTENEAGQEEDGPAARADGPAISMMPSGPFMGVIEGNFIYGWQQAVSAKAARNNPKAAFLVIRNTSDGKVDVVTEADKTKTVFEQNIAVPAGLMP
jgi:hypothetical protein